MRVLCQAGPLSQVPRPCPCTPPPPSTHTYYVQICVQGQLARGPRRSQVHPLPRRRRPRPEGRCARGGPLQAAGPSARGGWVEEGGGGALRSLKARWQGPSPGSVPEQRVVRAPCATRVSAFRSSIPSPLLPRRCSATTGLSSPSPRPPGRRLTDATPPPPRRHAPLQETALTLPAPPAPRR